MHAGTQNTCSHYNPTSKLVISSATPEARHVDTLKEVLLTSAGLQWTDSLHLPSQTPYRGEADADVLQRVLLQVPPHPQAEWDA